jgi:hypothetical protein
LLMGAAASFIAHHPSTVSIIDQQPGVLPLCGLVACRASRGRKAAKRLAAGR